MSIYRFIYCFSYKLKDSGKILASAHVLFTLIMHYLLLAEIFLRTTGIKILSIPNYGQYGSNKTMYFVFCIPLWLLIVIYFNKNRTNRLLLEYKKTYTNPRRNILKAISLIILPMVLFIFSAVLRQQSIV